METDGKQHSRTQKNFAKNAEFWAWHCEGAKGIGNGKLNQRDSWGWGPQNWRDGLTTRRSKCHNPWIVLGNMATSI